MFHNQSQENILQHLDQKDLDQLSPQQKKWAQNQYRMIYACIFISYQPRINGQSLLTNLTSQSNQKQSLYHTKLSRSTNKTTFFTSQGKNGQLQSKKTTKLQLKNQNIQTQRRKMDQKNLNYRNQIQTSKQRSYTKGRKVPTVIVKVLEGKKTQITTQRSKKIQQLSLNKTQHTLGKNQTQDLLSRKNNQASESFGKRNKILRFNVNIFQKNDFESEVNSDQEDVDVKKIRTIDIDSQISKHKQKSQLIQQQKQMIVFQNAMKRLAKIQSTREKGQKLKQPSKSPVEIRKPKKKVINQDIFNDNVIETNKKINSFYQSKSKQSLLDHSIQNHIKTKKLIEEQKIKQRDKIIEDQQKRKRQDRILKAIKNKIKEIKFSTKKMQLLQ